MKKYFYLIFVLLVFACSEEEVEVSSIKPAFIFKGEGVVLDSCPSEYLPAVYSVDELEFVETPGFAIVPDDKKMYEIAGQMAVVGYNPIFLVDEFQFSKKLVERFDKTTFVTKRNFRGNSVVAKFNSRKISYLTGVFACMATESHRFAYVGCDTLSNEAYVKINSFLLGAKSMDKNASVKWIKINKAGEEPLSEQIGMLAKENFSLIALCGKDRELEEAISSLNLPFVGYYPNENTDSQLAYFFCDNGQLWTKVLKDFFADSLAVIYESGFSDNSVRFLGYSDKLSYDNLQVMDSVVMNLDSLDIFVGPIFDTEGFLRVSEGEKISDENLELVNWLIYGIK